MIKSLIILVIAVTSAFAGSDSQMNLLTVTGSASGSFPPDLLTIDFNVRTLHENPQTALEKNSALIKQVSVGLTHLNVANEELSTSNFNLYPVYDSKYENNNYVQIFKGYEVSNRLSIRTTKLDLAGKIIDSAVKAGLNQIESVNFVLLPETKRKLEDSLIQEAVANAKKKADISLAAVAYEVKGVNSVALDGNSLIQPPRPGPENGAVAKGFAASDSMTAGTSLFSSNKDLTVSATVCFIIGPK